MISNSKGGFLARHKGTSMIIAGVAIVAISMLYRPSSTNPRQLITVQGHAISAEIAQTAMARAQGLMHRSELPAGEGMLFVFPDDKARQFWMKNTLLPLDILFFDRKGHLVSMASHAMPCTADPCQIYRSDFPARYVVEVPADTAKKWNLRIGAPLVVNKPH